MAQSITREAALRVALAARELGILSARELVSALVERLELPLTEAKLATVTVADLQLMLQGDEVIETDVPREQLKQAVRLLWGEGIVNSELPPVASYSRRRHAGIDPRRLRFEPRAVARWALWIVRALPGLPGLARTRCG
jgi:nitrogen fixation protein NifX